MPVKTLFVNRFISHKIKDWIKSSIITFRSIFKGLAWQYRLHAKVHVLPVLTLFRMGSFRAAHRWGGWGGPKWPPSLKSVTHIIHWWNLTFIPYQNKIQKIHKSCDAPLKFCWDQHFFTENQQFLVYYLVY